MVTVSRETSNRKMCCTIKAPISFSDNLPVMSSIYVRSLQYIIVLVCDGTGECCGWKAGKPQDREGRFIKEIIQPP